MVLNPKKKINFFSILSKKLNFLIFFFSEVFNLQERCGMWNEKNEWKINFQIFQIFICHEIGYGTSVLLKIGISGKIQTFYHIPYLSCNFENKKIKFNFFLLNIEKKNSIRIEAGLKPSLNRLASESGSQFFFGERTLVQTG